MAISVEQARQIASEEFTKLMGEGGHEQQLSGILEQINETAKTADAKVEYLNTQVDVKVKTVDDQIVVMQLKLESFGHL